MAGQQGAYIAHIINSGYVLGRGGMSDVDVPSKLTTIGRGHWLGDAVVDAAYAVGAVGSEWVGWARWGVQCLVVMKMVVARCATQ